MKKTPKTSLQALLRPKDSILMLIDHQRFQFANLNSVEPYGGNQQCCTEAVAAEGPFVMNSRSEIAEAYVDFYVGKYGLLNNKIGSV